jgi:amino acid transporter
LVLADTVNTEPQTTTNVEVTGIASGVKNKEAAQFGTLNGVFRPTILTILGVMMYLREGWVVGNAGLLGGIGVVLCCYLITGATALSISSITTNIRVGSGGVFSIISQALGLEVGGAVGIPLYLAQGLSAAMYMQGIIETWLYLFPEHHRLLVTVIVFAISFSVSYVGASIAFWVQAFVAVGMIAALASMFGGLAVHETQSTPTLIGNFDDGSFFVLFAVFFPASTGILVGSSLSGSLKNPRRAIPLGTMAAWGISLAVYLALAVWYALIATPEELRDTTRLISVERAYFGDAVLVGIIASCFSATLSSLVAAPRVLQALSQYRIVPFYQQLEKEYKGEPRAAILVTGVLVFVTLILGDLNAIAKILTMFFLVIYFMINLVLFIEHRLEMISFRPLFPIPTLVPIGGALCSLGAILVISPILGLTAIVFVMGIYIYLDHKKLKTPWETVHSGLFASIANWAAKKVILQQKGNSVARSWKPDLLIPIEKASQLGGYYRIVRALTRPQGSIQVAAFFEEKKKRESQELDLIINDFQRENLFATSALVESADFLGGLRTCISVKHGSFFKANTIFTPIENRTEKELQEIIHMAKQHHLGVIFLATHPESRLGRERTVNLWVRDQSPDWTIGLQLANLDYAVLMSYQLQRNWQADIRVLSVVKEEQHVDLAKEYLAQLLDYARMSNRFETVVEQGDFFSYLPQAPRADLNIMGLSETVSKSFLEDMVQRVEGSCLFVLDSGNESALA